VEDYKKDMENFIGKLNTFMNSTNEILGTLILEINNIKVDIDKIKKHKEKNLIITGR
jgi:hypothetical protein